MTTPSLTDVKGRLRDRLRFLCKAPEMCATTGRAAQGAMQWLIEDLSFLEGREDDAKPPDGWAPFWGQYGIVGRFDQTFDDTGRYMAEVVSVLAERAHILGHLDLDGPTGPTAARLREAAPDWFLTRDDVQRGEVEAEFGPPSLTVGHHVACYAPADRAPGWVFVDYHRPWPATHYVKGHGSQTYPDEYADDPLVRDVRVPADTWEDSLVLTPLGRYLRWGPSWWIFHPAKPHPLARQPQTHDGDSRDTETP